MLKEKLVEFLNENNLEFVDIIKDEKDFTVFRMSYEFDQLEKQGAKAYADEECEDGDEDEWNYDFYLPYLNDTAVDNVTDILEEFCDGQFEFQFIAFDVPAEDDTFNDFVCEISVKGLDVDLEEFLLESM